MLAQPKTVRKGYKRTELGEIPIEWDIVKLNQIANRITTKNKGTVSENVLTISAQYGLVSQTDFFNKQVASKNLEGYYLLERNDFAYNKSYSKGYPMGAIKPLEFYDTGVVSSLYICFKFNNDLTNVEFMKHYFDTNLWHEEVAQIAQEGARNHGLLNVSVKEFFNIKLILPSLKEQQKIAQILSTVDEQIKNIEQLITKTKELKKGLMQQLMTKGIGHTEFKQTELDEIPVGWKVYSMEEICERIIVGIASSTTEHYSDKESGVPIIRNQNIKENVLNTNEILYISYEFDKANSKKRLRVGDLLTVRTGYPGITAVVTPDYEGCQSFTTLISTPNQEIANSNYLAYYLNSPFGKEELTKLSAGGAQQNLNVGSFSKYRIKLPGLFEQQKIAEILSSVDEQIESYEQEREHYKELKQGLMQQLLTGEIRVTV